MIWSACYHFYVWQGCEPRRTPPATWPQLRPMQQGGTSRRCRAPPWSCRGARPPSTPRPTEPPTTSNQTKPQSSSSLAQLSSRPPLLDSEQKPSRWIVACNPPSVLSPALFCPPACPPVPLRAPCHHQPLTACSTPSHPKTANCPPTPDPPALQPAFKAGHGNLLSYRLYVP